MIIVIIGIYYGIIGYDYIYNSITFTFTAEKLILKVCIYEILLG